MSSWFPTIHTSFHTFSTTPSHLIPARPCATFSHAALRGISYGWQPLFWYVSSFILPFQLSQRVYVWTMLLQCGSIAVYGGAYVTRNQDPRWTQKPIYTPIFTHHIRSWLLCTPVIVRPAGASHLEFLYLFFGEGGGKSLKQVHTETKQITHATTSVFGHGQSHLLLFLRLNSERAAASKMWMLYLVCVDTWKLLTVFVNTLARTVYV